MRLTTFTDYCLRVLMYVGIQDGELATIDEIAASYGISRNHLMKVVFRLRQLGYLTTVRGKGGGMSLAQDPAEVNLGQLVRQTEEDTALAECFRATGAACRIEPCCVLKTVLGEALEAFFAVLDDHTLADLLTPQAALARLMGMSSRPAAAKLKSLN